MAAQYGPLVRLWGVGPSQVPLPTHTADDLTPLLTSILMEALPFINDVPTSYPSHAKYWSSKGSKSFSHSDSPVYLYERTVTAADLQAVANEHQLPHLTEKVQPETWVLRRSHHRDEQVEGTATWKEFLQSFKENHAEAEKAFTPTVMSTAMKQEWDCTGVEVELDGTTWVDWTLRLEESVHKMPAPLKNRVFPVLQATAAAQGRREFVVVQIAARDPKEEGREGEAVRGAYTSIERLREMGAGTEWVMGTASDAKGVLPAWMQKMAVPGAVAKDVDMFLDWIAKERKKPKTGEAKKDDKPKKTGEAKTAAETVSADTSKPAETPKPADETKTAVEPESKDNEAAAAEAS